MADDRIAAAAALLAQAWLDGTTIDAFPDELAPRDEAEATAMQDAMAARIGEDIVGWKVAGRPGAPFGRIFASTSFENGATLPAPRYAGNIMECEVGFRLKRDLPPRRQPYGREEVAAAADLSLNIDRARPSAASSHRPASRTGPPCRRPATPATSWNAKSASG